MKQPTALLISMRGEGDDTVKHELDCFKKHARRDLNWSQWNVAVDQSVPKTFMEYDLVLFGGSGDYSFVEPVAWMKDLAEATRGWVDAGQAMFCSCMGIQLLAYAHGGKIIKCEAGGEVGTYDILLTDEGKKDSLFSRLPSPFKAQQGHLDRIDNLGTKPSDSFFLFGNGMTLDGY